MFHSGDQFEARARQLRSQEIRRFAAAFLSMLRGKPSASARKHSQPVTEPVCANDSKEDFRAAA